MGDMPISTTPYSQGRQPCAAFQADKLNRPKTCPSCERMVQWCRSCLRTHHTGGWQTCPGQTR
jgi:hypothetical protein